MELRIFESYAQCRGTDSVLRTLAHLLAALSHATPKQAKEPKVTEGQSKLLQNGPDF